LGVLLSGDVFDLGDRLQSEYISLLVGRVSSGKKKGPLDKRPLGY